MKLSLEVPVDEASLKMNYHHQSFFLGSCFSEHISTKLKYFEFNCLCNPMGTFFHPFSIEIFLGQVYSNHRFSKTDVFQYKGVYRCFDAHSKLASLKASDLVNQLNQTIISTNNYLKKANFIWFSLGSAFVYWHKEQERYVANCHQLPANHFRKEFSSVQKIYESLYKIVSYLRSLQPELQIGFSISPVRHIKDGIVENTRSKSHLHTALYQLLEKDQDLVYFPAYEIFHDELRDYRFYASDLVHPNSLGIEYVWNKFKLSNIDSSCFNIMKKIDQWNRGNNHKVLFPNSQSHQQFLKFQERLRLEIENDLKSFQSSK